jgi:hypothetical protein
MALSDNERYCKTIASRSVEVEGRKYESHCRLEWQVVEHFNENIGKSVIGILV